MDNCDVRLLSYVAATLVLYSAPVHASDLCPFKVYARYMQQLDHGMSKSTSKYAHLLLTSFPVGCCRCINLFGARHGPAGTVDGMAD